MIIQVGKHRAPGWMWVCLAGALAACGGRVTTEDDGGAQPVVGPSPGVMGADEGGSDPSFYVCPPVAPAAASSCSMPADQGCKYQDYAAGVWSCTAFVCSSGKWREVSSRC